MEKQNLKTNLSEYLEQALKLDIQEDHLMPSSSSKSSSYYPCRLIEMKFNEESNHSANIIKKVFRDSQSPLRFQSRDDPIHNSEYRFLAAPPLDKNLTTECVAVPTSKHVAQILGKKGCKIRALRETTKTYIRSPLPNEEPVFVVKGKKDCVLEAVKAIKAASQFFSYIDKEKEDYCGIRSCREDSIVVKFTIPEFYVGIVVGIKGCTIKEIEKATNTYIKSPTMGSKPVFTITGTPEYCEKAMNFIVRYLESRGVGTGIVVECFSDLDSSPGSSSSTKSGEYSFTWVQTNPGI